MHSPASTQSQSWYDWWWGAPATSTDDDANNSNDDDTEQDKGKSGPSNSKSDTSESYKDSVEKHKEARVAAADQERVRQNRKARLNGHSPIRILALDGGGVRGYLTCILLQRMEKAHPGFMDSIDVFAGTSTGAIVAAGLAYGCSVDQMIKFYEEDAVRVFSRSIMEEVASLDGWTGSEFPHSPLRELLVATLGEATLDDTPRGLFVPTTDLLGENDQTVQSDSWHPRFFHNLNGSNDLDQKLVDLVMRSTAAPSIFPIYQEFGDGGIVANNPSLECLMGVLSSLDRKADGMLYSGSLGDADIRLLSLGTGRMQHDMKKYISAGNLDLGLDDWLVPLITMQNDAQSQLADAHCSQLLGSRYRRINPLLTESISLDDVQQMSKIAKAANETNLDDHIDWLHASFMADPEDAELL